MPTVFDTMVSGHFRDPNLSLAAVYSPKAGGSLNVRVIRRTPPAEIELLKTRGSAPAYAADVPVSAVAQPREGDGLAIGTESFVVRKYELDEERLVWQLDLQKEL